MNLHEPNIRSAFEILPLLVYWYDQNPEKVVAESVHNCHAIGVTSLMFNNEPGRRIRMFIAEKHHKLFDNYGRLPNHLAFHAHHCDLTLLHLEGRVINITAIPGDGPFAIPRWDYVSQLATGEPGAFTRATGEDSGLDYFSAFYERTLYDKIYLKSSDIHTVRVPYNEKAIWVVMEGAEDPNYRPCAWSPNDLSSTDQVDFTSLYHRGDSERIARLMEGVRHYL